MSKKEAMKEAYLALKDEVESIGIDVMRFYDGSNVAGTRVRKAMQSIKKKAQEMRIVVSEIKSDRSQSSKQTIV